MGEVFASAPFIVGRSEPPPIDVDIPAEEALCPVISHDWVNEQYNSSVWRSARHRPRKADDNLAGSRQRRSRIDGPDERAIVYRGGETIEWKIVADKLAG